MLFFVQIGRCLNNLNKKPSVNGGINRKYFWEFKGGKVGTKPVLKSKPFFFFDSKEKIDLLSNPIGLLT